jgi:hypothetical protein
MTPENIVHPLRGHAVAVINGFEAARSAARALKDAGFSEVTLYTSGQLEAEVDAKGDNSNFITKALRSLEDHLSEENNYLHQYQEEAKLGNQVLAVAVPDREGAERASEIIMEHGGHNVRYFAGLAVVDLDPASPTARSDAQPPAARPTRS